MTNEIHLLEKWFKKNGWKILPFQKEAWEQIHSGKSGLISVPTGAGKTYAAFLPALSKLDKSSLKGLQILYITPLKALAKDLEQALKRPIEDLELTFRVEKRTGDTTTSAKIKQKKSPPEILLTTPESLALLLTDKESKNRFANLQMIIVDEWHELLASKRGVLLELAIARLKKWSSQVQIWGLTATIGNIQEAAQVCVGLDRIPYVITTSINREVLVQSILPESVEKLPWAGHLGMRMLPYVLQHLDPAQPTLIFANTRSQVERWYQAILEAKPDWEKIIAIHHSSIDKKSRESIEEGIKSGNLRFVVCTSSLDLGIDLPEVEKVVQIGSPKSVARLIQRAGRSSHKPLTPCHLAMVPTHAMEVIELKAYRLALKEHLVESRTPLTKCYDVLLQHMTTCAIGGGFNKDEFYSEIITTSCYKDLTKPEFENCLQFLTTGGKALSAYSEYKKLIEVNSLYTVEDKTIILRHKMNIGTINSDPYVPVKMLRGKTLGLVEESFLTALKTGDSFLFAGRKLKLVQYRDMTAHVRLSKDEKTHTAVWRGSRLPFSAPLGKTLREALTLHDKELEKDKAENKIVQEILELQQSISIVPSEDQLLIEVLKSREGWHLFIYPFEGKTLHEGLALLIAHRISQIKTATMTLSANDYGFEILSNKPFDLEMITKDLFKPEKDNEIDEIINLHEAGKGCFRDVARIAGLVFQGYPGKHKSHRQVQISSGLIFEVLEKYDPGNLLVEQAKREVLDSQFDRQRIHSVLNRLSIAKPIVKFLTKFTPFSLPLYIERVSDTLSTESLLERIQNIQNSWKK